MMGDIQREKSKDPIISEPTYIHATNGMSVCIPATLHVQSDQPDLRLHSGMCGNDISVSGPVDRSGSRVEGMEVVHISEGLTSGNGMEGMERTDRTESVIP
jgi:hypothetical protein